MKLAVRIWNQLRDESGPWTMGDAFYFLGLDVKKDKRAWSQLRDAGVLIKIPGTYQYVFTDIAGREYTPLMISLRTSARKLTSEQLAATVDERVGDVERRLSELIKMDLVDYVCTPQGRLFCACCSDSWPVESEDSNED